MELKDAAVGFGALSQTTRLRVLRELVTAGPEGIAAGDLANAVDVPSSTLSFHLRELSIAGLVSSEKNGRLNIYKADYDGIRALIDFLIEDCCRGGKTDCGVVDLRSSFSDQVDQS